MYPTSLVAHQRFQVVCCDICNWVASTSYHRCEKYSISCSHYNFHIYLQNYRGCFLTISYKNC